MLRAEEAADSCMLHDLCIAGTACADVGIPAVFQDLHSGSLLGGFWNLSVKFVFERVGGAVDWHFVYILAYGWCGFPEKPHASVQPETAQPQNVYYRGLTD